MNMSTHIYAIKPADDHYDKMLAAYQACVAAGIAIPEEINKFFSYTKPEPAGVIVELRETDYVPCVKKWDDGESSAGFEVQLDLLPEHVKILRFVNSW